MNLIKGLFDSLINNRLLLQIVMPVILTFLLFVLTIYALVLPSLEANLMTRKREIAQEEVSLVLSLLQQYVDRVKSGDLTENEAQQRAKIAMRNLRYGTDGKDYFWIIDLQSNMLVHPYRQDLEGKNVTNYTDKNEKPLFRHMIEAAQTKGYGYVDYVWQWKDDPSRILPKISYVELFRPWGWIVGTGAYLEDVHRDIASVTSKLNRICLSILIIVGTVCLYAIWQAGHMHRIRQRAEEALRMSEQKFRGVFNQTFQSIALISLDGLVLEINDSALKTLGARREEILGRSLVDAPFWRSSENELQRIINALQSAREGGIVRYQATNSAAESEARVVDISIKPVLDQTGRVVFLVAEGRDITGLKRTTEALQESETRYRALFHFANDGIILFKDWCCIEGNLRAVDMLGTTHEELMVKTAMDFWPPRQPDGADSAEKAAVLVQRALVGIPQFVEWRYRRTDGSEFDAEVTLNRIEVHGETFVQAIIRDITERKHVEEERARLVAALEYAADEVILTTPEGIIQYVNPSFTRITGYSREESIGKTPAILKSGKHDRAFYENLWGTLLGGEIWKGNIINRRKDGLLITEEATISPILDPVGHIIGFVSVKRDVTEQVITEAQLRQAQKMEAIGTLAAGIAHDFNNILSAVLGYSELSLAEVPKESAIYNNLQEVLRAGRRATDLIRQILTFSRQTESTRQPTILTPLVKETLALLRRSLPYTIEIVSDLDPNSSPVFTDPTQIHQVLMNLCTNAFHAMEDQGGVLSVSLTQIEANADSALAGSELSCGRYVCLTVSDTGCGMDDAVRQRIFDPFYTTKPEGKGTGMGLSIVHGIVKSHHGAIQVQSDPGHGTEFRIYLPVFEDIVKPMSEAPPPIPRGNGESVILVDDETSVLNIATLQLERLGYRVTPFSSPLDAIKHFRTHPEQFDVVITDGTMPHMSGIMLAEEIRSVRSDIPIILATGFSTDQVGAKALVAGIRRVMTKPVGIFELAAALQEALHHPNT